MKYDKLRRKFNTRKKGGVVVNAVLVDRAFELLQSFDRMPEEKNSWAITRQSVERMLKGTGCIELIVITCPPIRAGGLIGSNPEEFFPQEVNIKEELIYPRLPLIKKLLEELKKQGVPVRLFVVVGDGMLEYWNKVFNISVDEDKVLARRLDYSVDLQREISEYLPGWVSPYYLTVSSVTLEGIEALGDEVLIPERVGEMAVESEKRTYKEFYNEFMGELSWEEFYLVGTTKTRQYAAIARDLLEGRFLLATGGKDTVESWMSDLILYSLGSPKVRAIFPWIRKEVLQKYRGGER